MAAKLKELPLAAFSLKNVSLQADYMEIDSYRGACSASCDMKGLVSFEWTVRNFDGPALYIETSKGREMLPPSKGPHKYDFPTPYTGKFTIGVLHILEVGSYHQCDAMKFLVIA